MLLMTDVPLQMSAIEDIKMSVNNNSMFSLLKRLSVLEMIYEKTQEVGNVKGMLRIMDTAGSVGLLMDSTGNC